jgi:hypothetical protein
MAPMAPAGGARGHHTRNLGEPDKSVVQIEEAANRMYGLCK